jgi:hypothetical protein
MPKPMESVSDHSSERKYFTQVCNIIDELDLSPLAIALYLHYKRWSGTIKKASPGLKFLTKKFKVSTRKIQSAKAELIKNKLIKVKSYDKKLGKADEIAICDIWDRNHKHFHKVTPHPIAIQQYPIANEQQVGPKPIANEQYPLLPDSNTLKNSLEEHSERGEQGPPAVQTDLLISETSALLKTVFDLETKTLLARSVPPQLVHLWIEFAAARSVSISKTAAHDGKLRQLGYWITDFRKDYKNEYDKLRKPEQRLPSPAEKAAQLEEQRKQPKKSPVDFMRGLPATGQVN